MAITRINNNQITDSIEGNVYYGINAAASQSLRPRLIDHVQCEHLN